MFRRQHFTQLHPYPNGSSRRPHACGCNPNASIKMPHGFVCRQRSCRLGWSARGSYASLAKPKPRTFGSDAAVRLAFLGFTASLRVVCVRASVVAASQ